MARRKSSPRVSEDSHRSGNDAKRLDVDARRRQLLDIGKKLFSKYAYDELSTDELAELAGISKGLLYHYFKSKRDYYVETIREVARQVIADTTPQPGLPLDETIERSLLAFIEFVDAKEAIYRALVNGGIGSDREVAGVVQELRDVSCQRVFETLSMPDPSPLLRAAVFGWTGFVEFACLHWTENRSFTKEQLLDLLKRGLTQMTASAGS